MARRSGVTSSLSESDSALGGAWQQNPPPITTRPKGGEIERWETTTHMLSWLIRAMVNKRSLLN